MKYGTFRYGAATYGDVAKSTLSVEPMTATAIDYGQIQVSWQNAIGTYSAVRLLRNTDGFPETAEDGIIIWQKYLTALNRTKYLDGSDNYSDTLANNDVAGANQIPLPDGGYVFYGMWLRGSDGLWVPAGYAYTLMPKKHGTFTFDNLQLVSTHDKVMELLPRVYTSATNSPLDEVNTDSDLYLFLEPFSFTYDQFLTYTDFLATTTSGKNINPNFLENNAKELGLIPELALPEKTQKKLIRDALYVYSRKGTASSVSALMENLTGFAPTITSNKNLFLTIQDSSFYNDYGRWLPTGNMDISLETTTVTPSEPNAVNNGNCLKIVVSTAGAVLANGTSTPTTLGIPITASTSYSFSYYVKSASGTPYITPSIYWYDYQGNFINVVSDSSTAVSTTWARKTFTTTSPANAQYAAVTFYFSTAATYYLDMMQFSLASITDYHEAGCVDIFFAPTKTNLVTNPSFEVNTTGWTINHATATTPSTTLNQVLDGTKMLQLATDGTTTTSASPTLKYSTSAGNPTNQFYTFSFYAKVTSGTQSMTLALTANDGTTTASKAVAVGLSVGWTRFTVSLQVPSTLVSASTVLTASLYGTTGSKTILVDACQLEASYAATDYFDGSYPSSYGAFWAGTAHASVSYYYANKAQKLARVPDELATVLPIGTPFVVSTYAGIESVGVV